MERLEPGSGADAGVGSGPGAGSVPGADAPPGELLDQPALPGDTAESRPASGSGFRIGSEEGPVQAGGEAVSRGGGGDGGAEVAEVIDLVSSAESSEEDQGDCIIWSTVRKTPRHR